MTTHSLNSPLTVNLVNLLKSQWRQSGNFYDAN